MGHDENVAYPVLSSKGEYTQVEFMLGGQVLLEINLTRKQLAEWAAIFSGTAVGEQKARDVLAAYIPMRCGGRGGSM